MPDFELNSEAQPSASKPPKWLNADLTRPSIWNAATICKSNVGPETQVRNTLLFQPKINPWAYMPGGVLRNLAFKVLGLWCERSNPKPNQKRNTKPYALRPYSNPQILEPNPCTLNPTAPTAPNPRPQKALNPKLTRKDTNPKPYTSRLTSGAFHPKPSSRSAAAARYLGIGPPRAPPRLFAGFRAFGFRVEGSKT